MLDTFEAQPLSEDDGNANNLEEEEAAAFNIKYLTSSKLMGLEVTIDHTSLCKRELCFVNKIVPLLFICK